MPQIASGETHVQRKGGPLQQAAGTCKPLEGAALQCDHLSPTRLRVTVAPLRSLII